MMGSYRGVAAIVLALAPHLAAGSGSGRREDRRVAPDGVTVGWLVTYGNPDPGRDWERIAGTLVIARRGQVVRRIEGASTIRQWTFRHGGSQVVVETGALHGPTQCILTSVRTGRTLAETSGACDAEDEAAPAWVKALARIGPGKGGPGGAR